MPSPRQPAGPQHWSDRHLWHIQPVRDLLVVAAILGLIYLGYVVRIVTTPLLLAVLLAYLFEPLILRATRVRWISRTGAAAGILVACVVLIGGPVLVGAGFGLVQAVASARATATDLGQLAESSRGEPNNPAYRGLPSDGWRVLSDGIRELRERAAGAPDPSQVPVAPPGVPVAPPGVPVAPPGEGSGDAGADGPAEDPDPARSTAPAGADEGWLDGHTAAVLTAAVDGFVAALRDNAASIGKQAIGTGVDAIGAIVGFVASAGKLIFMAFLTGFFFVFVSTGWGRLLAFWEGLIPERRRGRAVELARQMDRVVSGFVRGRLAIAAVQAVVLSLGYWLIGVPAPLILGVVVAVLSIVPYLGQVGVPVTILLLWLQPSGPAWQEAWWWVIGAPVVVYLVAQALDDYVLTPLIQGKATDMDMPTILFAVLAGGSLAGVYGLLLAIPVAACLKILARELVWPRVKAWGQGRARDVLPISESEAGRA